jgi:hypothetical protein
MNHPTNIPTMVELTAATAAGLLHFQPPQGASAEGVGRGWSGWVRYIIMIRPKFFFFTKLNNLFLDLLFY